MGFLNDPLYGKVDTSAFKELLELPAVSRLSDISLSINPNYFMGMNIASRYEHSIGVAHLAEIACTDIPELEDKSTVLQVSALLHDGGSPPFSHLSEIFMKEALGKTHEENVDYILTSLETPLRRLNVSPTEVENAINGGLFCVLNGGRGGVDLDNLDNTLRYGIYVGQIDPKNLPYNPELLASSSQITGERWQINPDTAGVSEEFREYHHVRQKVYDDFVYGDFNLSRCAFLFSALYLAYREGELCERFFGSTDTKAVNYLHKRCNPGTAKIIGLLSRQTEFQKIFEIWTKEPSDKLKSLCKSPMEVGQLCVDLRRDLGLKPHELAVYALKSTACKGAKHPDYILKVFGKKGLKISPLELERYLR